MFGMHLIKSNNRNIGYVTMDMKLNNWNINPAKLNFNGNSM